MNNIIVTYPNKEIRKFYNEHKIDGFIIGIKNYSENFNFYLDESSLKSTIDELNNNNIKAYIMLRRIKRTIN